MGNEMCDRCDRPIVWGSAVEHQTAQGERFLVQRAECGCREKKYLRTLPGRGAADARRTDLK